LVKHVLFPSAIKIAAEAHGRIARPPGKRTVHNNAMNTVPAADTRNAASRDQRQARLVAALERILPEGTISVSPRGHGALRV
jgi:hypothetical protein